LRFRLCAAMTLGAVFLDERANRFGKFARERGLGLRRLLRPCQGSSGQSSEQEHSCGESMSLQETFPSPGVCPGRVTVADPGSLCQLRELSALFTRAVLFRRRDSAGRSTVTWRCGSTCARAA